MSEEITLLSNRKYGTIHSFLYPIILTIDRLKFSTQKIKLQDTTENTGKKIF